jgi:hypothetical protein
MDAGGDPAWLCRVGEGFFRKTTSTLLHAPSTTPEDAAAFEVFARARAASFGGSSKPGDPPTNQDLINWTSQFEVDYPSVLDEPFQLHELFTEDAFPKNFIIDTSTMEIIELAGPVDDDPQDPFWIRFQQVIDGAP